MNIAMAFLQLITILGISYFEYKRGSISVFLWATLLVMFGLPHLASSLVGSATYGPDVTIQASLFVISFNIVYFSTRLVLKDRCKPLLFGIWEATEEPKTAELYRNRVIVQILFMNLLISIGIIIYYSYKLLGGVLSTSWSSFYFARSNPYDLRSNMGFARNAAIHLLFASGGVIVTLWNEKRYAPAFVAMLAVLCYAIITRNRITVLPLFVSIIVIYVSRHRRVRIREVVVYGLVAVIAIYSVEAMRLFRHYGSISDFVEVFSRSDFHRHVLDRILEGDSELGLRNVFYYFIANDNRFPRFGKGDTYIRLLLMLIPQRYSLGLKPQDFAISMGSAYVNDFSNTQFSTHPTLYGDCYANLWWYGILLGVFWAMFVLATDRIANRKNPIIRTAFVVLFGCMYVIIGRGSVYNGANIGFISGLYLLVLNVAL